MRLRGLVVSVSALALISLVACSPGESETGIASANSKEQEKTPALEKDFKAEGEAVGKEILATFDLAVAEVAAALKGKPEPAEAKARIQEIIGEYKPLMEALAEKKLSLLPEIQSWGAVNSYLDENRGKRIFNKDNALGEFMTYYTIRKPDLELNTMLSSRLVELIDIADAPRPN